MSVRSMTEVAYSILEKSDKPLVFSELWEKVRKEMGYSDSQAAHKIASFYSSLMLDKKFVVLEDNIWDLRSRHTFSETYVDTSELEMEDDLISEEDFDRELELEYLDNDNE